VRSWTAAAPGAGMAGGRAGGHTGRHAGGQADSGEREGALESGAAWANDLGGAALSMLGLHQRRRVPPPPPSSGKGGSPYAPNSRLLF